MPRRLRQVVIGASPLVRPLAQPLGRSPNQGHSPQSKKSIERRGTASPHIGAAEPLRISRELTCVFLAN